MIQTVAIFKFLEIFLAHSIHLMEGTGMGLAHWFNIMKTAGADVCMRKIDDGYDLTMLGIGSEQCDVIF